MANAIYWGKIAAILSISVVLIFELGYLWAILRRSKHPASIWEEVEAQVNFLKVEIKSAKDAMAELFKILKPDMQPKVERPKSGIQSYKEPEGTGKMKQFISALLKRDSEATKTQDSLLIESLQQIKEEIKGITADIQTIITWDDYEYEKSKPANRSQSYPAYPEPARPTVQQSKMSTPEIDHSYYERSKERSYNSDHYSSQNTVLSQSATKESSAADLGTKIIELYNCAVTDTAAREQFREQYQPLRLGTVNAVERRQNPTIEAEYRGTSDGDFFAFAIPGKNEYAVVPRLGLTIEAVSYNAGALGEVFSKTQGHDPKLFYSRYRVVEPARFKRDGERWELLSPGELDLGPGD